jgi:hypothetical protein
MRNTVAEAPTRNTPRHPLSIRLCCLLFGAAMLATATWASEPAPETSRPTARVNDPLTPCLRGIDISASAGEPASEDFGNIKQQGFGCVIVGGWGGVNRNHRAQIQLSRARDAGLLTAGYCYMNFASASDGACQVREALTAFGCEAAYLRFLAIDVESYAINQLSPGLQQEAPDAAAQRQAVERIAEAVQEAQRAGLRAVIYTKKSDWKRVTGNTAAFSALPLWWTQVGPPSLRNPDLSSPAWTFGGWTNYVGKQYLLEKTLTASAIPVDLNIFDAAAFATGNPDDKPLLPGPGGIRVAVNR